MGWKKYRLVTRSDFDGLVCAVLLRSLDLIDEIAFVHPKDVQDALVEVGPGDILTNLPYAPAAHVVFDHHHSETVRIAGTRANHVIDPQAPSAARVVYEFYGGADTFPQVSEELMWAVDQADSAQYTLDDIVNPTGWTLLNFIMDSRTGLGRFHDFRISNRELMMGLIDEVLRGDSVDTILAGPDVAERVGLFTDRTAPFMEQLRRVGSVVGDLVVIDLRGEDVIHPGNRFMVYALFPRCRVSAHVMWGRDRRNTVLAVGKSILDRSSPVDIGAMMLEFGGGGHRSAGTCQVAHDQADHVLRQIGVGVNEALPVG